MRINQYISSFVFVHALAARAGEGAEPDKVEKDSWVMSILVPVDSDYFIKTSNSKQQIDDGEADGMGWDDKRVEVVPDQEQGQEKITTKYHVIAQMAWDATNATEPGGRGFWVGRGGDQKLLQDLEKVSLIFFERIALTPFQYIVKPRDWLKGDVTLWLGPDLSYAKALNSCDSLDPGWLQCLGRGKGVEAKNDWNGAYFREPKIAAPDPKDCAARSSAVAAMETAESIYP
jgi:hypothetical protein